VAEAEAEAGGDEGGSSDTPATDDGKPADESKES
jgi:hypothetical protein